MKTGKTLDVKFPSLGNSAKLYTVTLTEPEINCIYALTAFVAGACMNAPEGLGLRRYWEHYGPTAQGLSDKLTRFDDSGPVVTA
jgi:hypothetical protein